MLNEAEQKTAKEKETYLLLHSDAVDLRRQFSAGEAHRLSGLRQGRLQKVRQLLDQGLTPVFCAINHDGDGQLLNTNADTMAAAISVALGARLFYCFEMGGVLHDRNDAGSVIPSLDPDGYARLKAEGRVADGMIPKLDNAFAALRDGAAGVVIRSAEGLAVPGGTALKTVR